MSALDRRAGSVGGPDSRTLRMETFGARFERITAAAAAAGIAEEDVVLPAEGVVRGAGGLRLHHLEWPGARDGPLLLMLHGGGLHAHSFDVAGLLLRHVGRTVALDLRGHGESDWAGEDGYGPEALVADLDAVVAAFATRPVVVIGHSLGGMAALTWAARGPTGLAGLVVLDVGPEIDHDAGRSVGEAVAQRPLFVDLADAESFFSRRVPGGRVSPAVAATLRWTDDGLLTVKHDVSQFRTDRARVPTTAELRDAATRVACPTLVLRGARSRVLGDEAAAEFAELLPDGRWERVPDAGHTIQSGNPRGLADAVTRFLHERVPRTTVPASDDRGAHR